MAWIRVDDHFDEHPKMQMVGPLGWGIWLAGLAYCNRNLTDGFIPYAKARTLASFDVVEDDGKCWSLSRSSGMVGDEIDADWVIGLLIDAGLWEPVHNDRGRLDGFHIHDYGDYQPSAERVKAEREATRKRVEAHRNKPTGRFGNGDVTALPERYIPVSNAVSNGDVTTAPTPNPIPNPRKRRTTPPLPPAEAETPPVEPVAASPPPVNEPHRLFSVYCDLAVIDQSDVPKATKDKQHGIFKNLLDKFAAADIEGCMQWLTTWRTVPWKPESLWEHLDTWILENRPTSGKRQPPPPKPVPLRAASSGVVSKGQGDRQRQIIGR